MGNARDEHPYDFHWIPEPDPDDTQPVIVMPPDWFADLPSFLNARRANRLDAMDADLRSVMDAERERQAFEAWLRTAALADITREIPDFTPQQRERIWRRIWKRLHAAIAHLN